MDLTEHEDESEQTQEEVLLDVLDKIKNQFNSNRKINNVMHDASMKGKEEISDPDDVVRIIERAKEAKEREKYHSLFILSDKILNSCPGFVGEVASWITENAPKPQPALSVGSVLALMGAIKGHRFRSTSDIRTNIYALGIADTGTGKEFPLFCLDKLLKESGHGDIKIDEPASGQAFPGMIQESGGRGLLIWDEIGDTLSACLGQKANGFERKIVTELLKLYGASSREYSGSVRADRKLNPTVKIDSPCLSLWGTSGPEAFYKSITGSSVSDGFLPRFLIFTIKDPFVRRRDDIIVDDIPEEFKTELLRYLKMPTNVKSKGEFDFSIKPAIMDFERGGKEKARQMEDVIEDYRRIEMERGSGLGSFWSRSYVHVIKVAMAVSDGPMITREALDWAFDLVLEITEGSCEAFTKNSHSSESSKLIDKTLKKITELPGATKGVLLSKLGMKKSELDPILETLRIRGDVKVVLSNDSLTKKAHKYYRF